MTLEVGQMEVFGNLEEGSGKASAKWVKEVKKKRWENGTSKYSRNKRNFDRKTLGRPKLSRKICVKTY